MSTTIKVQSVANAKNEQMKKDGSTRPTTKSPKVVTTITPEALENAFFSLPEIKKEMHKNEIDGLTNQIKTLSSKCFTTSLELTRIVARVQNYWKAEGKDKAKAFGMTADKHTLPKRFNYSQQHWNVLANAGNVPETVVAEYVAYCEKGRVNPSIERMLEYYKKSVGKGQHDTDGDGDGDGDGKKVQTIFTLSYKTENGNVSVRVDNLGKVTTSNTKEDIKNALIFLSTHIVSLEK